MSVDVVLCGDRNVLWGMAVAGRSALEAATCPLHLHVITSGFRDGDLADLRHSWDHPNCAGVTFAEIDLARLSGFRSTAYLKSKLSYARYFLADLFPGLGRCIYIDTDVIVGKDLAAVATLDLEGHGLAAALDGGTLRNPVNPERRARLGLRSEARYFNAGVLVIDQPWWQAHGVPQELVELSVTRFHDLHSQDQDALNIVFEDRVVILDPSWNVSQYAKPEPLAGHIVHLLGTDKPWHALYRRKFAEPYYRDVIWAGFYDILDRTAYAGQRPPHLMGLAPLVETIRKKLPTRDMVFGKLVRSFRR